MKPTKTKSTRPPAKQEVQAPPVGPITWFVALKLPAKTDTEAQDLEKRKWRSTRGGLVLGRVEARTWMQAREPLMLQANQVLESSVELAEIEIFSQEYQPRLARIYGVEGKQKGTGDGSNRESPTLHVEPGGSAHQGSNGATPKPAVDAVGLENALSSVRRKTLAGGD